VCVCVYVIHSLVVCESGYTNRRHITTLSRDIKRPCHVTHVSRTESVRRTHTSTTGYTVQQATLYNRLHCTTGYAVQKATLYNRLHCTTGYTVQQATLYNRLHCTTGYTVDTEKFQSCKVEKEIEGTVCWTSLKR